MQEDLFKCYTCKIYKTREHFSKNKKKKNGLNGQCRDCKSISDKKYRKDNAEAISIRRRKSWQDNIEINKERQRVYYENNKEKIQQSAKEKKYNLPWHVIEKMIEDQNYLCAICFKDFRKSEQKFPINIDHCHLSNKVRGILCSKCNLGIGHFEDSIDMLENAIRYLKERGI